MKQASTTVWPDRDGRGEKFPGIPDTKPAKWSAQLAVLAEMIARSEPGQLLYRGKPLNVTTLTAVELCRAEDVGHTDYKEWHVESSDFAAAAACVLAPSPRKR